MSSEISQRELRNNSGEIMRRLDEGEAFIDDFRGLERMLKAIAV